MYFTGTFKHIVLSHIYESHWLVDVQNRRTRTLLFTLCILYLFNSPLCGRSNLAIVWEKSSSQGFLAMEWRRLFWAFVSCSGFQECFYFQQKKNGWNSSKMYPPEHHHQHYFLFLPLSMLRTSGAYIWNLDREISCHCSPNFGTLVVLTRKTNNSAIINCLIRFFKFYRWFFFFLLTSAKISVK